MVVNPLVVAGQLHGGVVQGIGQALMEMTVYDADGQLLTGSFMDYAMPRATDAPPFVLAEHPVPAKTNPLGVKGCGEAGCAGSLTSIMNAVMNALADRGIRHVDMPLTPFRIWQALQKANGAGCTAPETMTRRRFQSRRNVPAQCASSCRVCAAHFLSHYYMIILAPLFAFVRADYGVSYTDLGLALTAFNLVSAVFQTPAGFLVDRIGARTVLIAGVAVGAAAFAVAGLVNSFVVFVAMFGVAGLANTAYHPADYSLLSDHGAPARISQIFSYHTFAGILGGAVAPATLLVMQSHFGWRGAFVGAAILGLRGACDLGRGAIVNAGRQTGSKTPRGTAGWRRRGSRQERSARLAASALAADPAQSLFLYSDLADGRAL